MKIDGRQAERLRAFFQKYRWPCLILLAGVALMLLTPGAGTEDSGAAIPAETAQQPDDGLDYCTRTERRLARILSKIDGAGQVEVMLTLRTGPTSRYQTDLDTRSQTSEGREETQRSEKTVLFSRGSTYNEPAVAQTELPRFLGALIVSPGADDPAVRYALISAVSSVLGLGADQITVVRMR